MPTATRTLWTHLAVFVAVFAYYQVGNSLWEPTAPLVPLPHDASAAHENAWKLYGLEQRLGLDWERDLQTALAPHAWVMWPLALFYAGPHFALSLGFLVWVYRYRHESFAYVRNAGVWFTTTAFAWAWLFPVAPPRLVSDLGLQDTIQELLPINNRTPWINTLVNDYAAFPSVHTGWALLVAILAIRLTHSRWRWLWLLYPAAIVASIMGTANHFTWDVVGAGAWVGVCELSHQAAAARWRLPLARAPAPRALPQAVANASDEAGVS